MLVTCVEDSSRWNRSWKKFAKKAQTFFGSCPRYQNSRHLFQNPKNHQSAMGFSNHAQSFTTPYFLDVVSPYRFDLIYGRNQSGCEKAKNLGFLPFLLWVFLTIYICVALTKITMRFKQLEVSHIMSLDSWNLGSALRF